jgi:hypothetical protein
MNDRWNREWSPVIEKHWSDDKQWLSEQERHWSSEIEKHWLSDRNWISERGQHWTSEIKKELRSERQWLADRDWWPKRGLGWGKSPGATQCFLRGTRILTTNGEIRVETLRAGDRVVTVRNERLPIKCIRRHLVADNDASQHPIRVSRFALDETSPRADLYLSPGHALYLDGVLIPVGEIINGKTIVPAVPNGIDAVEYFHIELDTHEVVFAEGAPVETLLVAADERYDDGTRGPSMMKPYAPVAGYKGGRAALQALVRRAAYPVIDIRDPIQVVYDRVACRAC